MSKLIKIVCFILLVAVDLSWAKSPKYFIGGELGRAFENENIYPAFIAGVEAGIQSNHFGASISYLNFTNRNTEKVFQPGFISMNPVILSATIRVPSFRNRFAFYAGGGIAYIFADHEIDKSISESVNHAGGHLSENIQNGIGSNAMGGFEYFLTHHVSVSLETIYIFYKTNVTTTFKGADKFSIPTSFSYQQNLNLDTLICLFKLRAYF